MEFNFTIESNDSNTLNKNQCFALFDKDGDGMLRLEDFTELCKALFRNEKNEPYDLKHEIVYEIFQVFDQNQDSYIDQKEFDLCWEKWISIILNPTSALIIVDVQNDFISGSLKVTNAADVVEPINNLLKNFHFTTVLYSLDWHPDDHISFCDNVQIRRIHAASPVKAEDAKLLDLVIFEGPPKKEQILWPKHCVQGTWGAEIHKDLKMPKDAIPIYKGINSECDSYSAFWDNNKLSQTDLNEKLKARNVSDLYICGLAIDFCVGGTILDALKEGYRTVMIDDCTMGIESKTAAMKCEEIKKDNGVIVKTEEVKALIEAKDRRFEMGYQLALNLKKKFRNLYNSKS